MEIKKKKCRADGCQNEFQPFRTTDKFCSLDCAIKSQKAGKPKKMTRINPISKKRRVEQLQYSADRVIFLQRNENKYCPIAYHFLKKDDLTPDEYVKWRSNIEAVEVHHKKGRIGSLYLDRRFWLAVSSEGHKYIHENDNWSRENGFLLSRHENNGEENK